MMKSKMLSNKNNSDLDAIVKEKFLEKRNERIELLGKDEALEIEKRIFLQLIDQNWKLHIQYLEQLKTSNWFKILWSKRSTS